MTRGDVAAMNRAGERPVAVDQDGVTRWIRASTTAAVLTACTTGPVTMRDVETRAVGADLIVVTYTKAVEQTCDGRKEPPTFHSLSVWQQRGGRWVAIAHSDSPAAPTS
jgi:hypothetical protein